MLAGCRDSLSVPINSPFLRESHVTEQRHFAQRKRLTKVLFLQRERKVMNWQKFILRFLNFFSNKVDTQLRSAITFRYEF